MYEKVFEYVVFLKMGYDRGISFVYINILIIGLKLSIIYLIFKLLLIVWFENYFLYIFFFFVGFDIDIEGDEDIYLCKKCKFVFINLSDYF